MSKLKRAVLHRMAFLCALLLLPFSAYAAGTISVTKTGEAVFTLVANGLDAPTAMDIVVNFDSSRLSNPRVAQGTLTSGALFAANTGIAGMVRFAVVSTQSLNGSGPIATITFDQVGGSAGAITVSGTVINQAGTKLSVSYNGWTAPASTTPTPGTVAGGGNNNSGGSSNVGNQNKGGGAGTANTAGASGNTSTASTPGSTNTTGASGTSNNTGGYGAVGGTLTMPSDDAAARERTEAPVQQDYEHPTPEPTPQEVSEPAEAVEAVEGTEPVATQSGDAKAPEGSPQPVRSVLEKFRLFTGEKTAKNLVGLFERDPAASFSQVPALAVADGKASVTVTIAKASGNKAPNFAFSGARYLSLQRPADDQWQVAVMPEQGALRASISVLTNGAVQELPLTVTPRAAVDLDQSGKVTEADFLLFLKAAASGKAPGFDLNGDGKRDYQDEYIFTANYLVQTAKNGAGRYETKVPR